MISDYLDLTVGWGFLARHLLLIALGTAASALNVLATLTERSDSTIKRSS